ncbi:MAG: aminoacetone oxidase family FAD-binding enzyme [Planctomycetes bacterium]|nr:aminoacetone oxidase family FAD-binding enzyme [Planctomycetota bacterium]MDP6407749.1 aminoacetone oxidase family FAD-binding enzyme [Planctomycetota bacterium]
MAEPGGGHAPRRARLIVVGGGAAGIWAAARAARLGGDVLLLEKTPRVGTKVLASGGSRCNLTTTLPGDEAARLFGPAGARFLRKAFGALGPAAVRERFAVLGLETVEAPLEKVFPASQRARDVRDVLERDARAAGVKIRCGVPVSGIEPSGGGGWRVLTEGGGAFLCERLLLCTGGASVPSTGTTGDAYPWLRELDLEVVAPRPALVPLTSDAAWVRELAGVSLQAVEVRLIEPLGGRTLRRRRPVVFTHRGLSGPGPLDLSRHVTAPGGARELLLDLACDTAREDLRRRLLDAAARGGVGTLARALDLPLPRRLLDAACRQAGLADSRARVSELPRGARHDLIEALKGLVVPLAGGLGFEHAEVTAGGLALSAVDPATMEVRGRGGLQVCGELLDLDGPIGGFNFQAAFATAELAGRHAARGG